ncbi:MULTISPECIES: hypothetical protein [unclassified Pseudodesulfovibrio]|uniref:hypothetical protein n=1 Tax=unclassified Pseudodesulfovibrio TaxID=2661612 RepID=UPI000FEC088E|nr:MULTISPECIES: hypothetical protein [unclassified Pseudodesulfovibrio]MCJ2164634.1 hypothetical protein [Pseudodesulfovibrio sp. S3-i]RWU04172.1 hypothetical protein DWB63_09195 [Pseudodesulfovibrio sp. S3]
MLEAENAIFICTQCGRIFYGSPDEGDSPLPCGHRYTIAASPVMLIRDCVLADQVWDLVGDDIGHSNIFETLKAMIND